MIKEAQTYQEFKSLNNRDILDFPLHVPMGIDMLDFLEDTFDKYYKLVVRIINNQDVENKDINIETIKELGKILINILKCFRNGNIADAYLEFEKKMAEFEKLLPIVNIKGEEFFRMRKEKNLERISQFYPLPPELRYLSGAMRFSIPGYTCFYIGHSKSVCKKEINNVGSIVKVKLKDDVTFKLLDLTFREDMNNGGENESHLIMLWPLIASCYLDHFYCLLGKRVCKPRDIRFNENYVIPQLLTTYIRRKRKDIEGIRYYTVKDDSLEIFGKGENDMRNVVLYVDSSSDKSYDEFIDKFEWEKPLNVSE